MHNAKSSSNFQFAIFMLLFALASVVACGKKGDPRIPELATPARISDLKAQADRRGIVLTWSRPTRYIDGKELRELAGFVIFRKGLPQGCPECPAPYRERTSVDVEDQQKFIKKRQFRFVDEELSPQTIYRFRVSSKLTDGSLSDPSNEVEVAWRP